MEKITKAKYISEIYSKGRVIETVFTMAEMNNGLSIH